ncbi:MAG: SDR family NAD(P)-dependent oxidoreductase [Pseudomonadota bacterium]
MTDDKPLNGQVALVTGAARGIGAASAALLGRDGAVVYAADIDACDDTLAALEAVGARGSGHRLDVRDRERTAALVGSILQREGRLDMLVCNAGICPPGGVAGDWEQWRRVLEINLDGTQHCVAAAWEPMVAAGGGSIVIVSSMAFYRGGLIVGTEYSASKGALIGMTRHLARNGGRHGIRCNAVAPGIIDTAMTADFDKPPLEDIVLGRYGTAEDVAGPIRFLCGPESAYMTGTVLNVTGGIVLAA